VLGLDLGVAFAVGGALGYDAKWLAEFLPEIEIGMVKSVHRPDPDYRRELARQKRLDR